MEYKCIFIKLTSQDQIIAIIIGVMAITIRNYMMVYNGQLDFMFC